MRDVKSVRLMEIVWNMSVLMDIIMKVQENV